MSKRNVSGHIIANNDIVQGKFDAQESIYSFFNTKYVPMRINYGSIMAFPKTTSNGVLQLHSHLQQVLFENKGESDGKKDEDEEYNDLIPLLSKYSAGAVSNDVDVDTLQPNEYIPISIGGISTVNLYYKIEDKSEKRLNYNDRLCLGVVLRNEALDPSLVGKFTLKKYTPKVDVEYAVSSLLNKKHDQEPKTKRAMKLFKDFALLFIKIGMKNNTNEKIVEFFESEDQFNDFDPLKEYKNDKSKTKPKDSFVGKAFPDKEIKFQEFMVDLFSSWNVFKTAHSLPPVAKVVGQCTKNNQVNVKWI